jgi:outer membrane protein assembly factor BamB
VPTYGGLAWADDRHAVVVASDGLRGIDLTTGATTWRHEVRGLDSRYDTGYTHGSIVVASDAGAEQGTQARTILLLDALTGAERGALPVPRHDIANRVTTAGGLIYVESPRRTYAIDAVTGRARWAVGNWPTETVDTDPVDGTAYLWDGKTRRYRVVGPDGRATTIGETVRCALRAGTSLSCNTQAVARQQIVGYAASDGTALWTSPVLPYFRAPYSLSQSPSMPPPSYAAGIVCGHVDARGPDEVRCTEPYLLAVNR